MNPIPKIWCIFLALLSAQTLEELSINILLMKKSSIKLQEKLIFSPERALVKRIVREIPQRFCSFENLVVERVYKHDFYYYPFSKVRYGEDVQIIIEPKNKEYFSGKTNINLEYRCKNFWQYQDDQARGTVYLKGFESLDEPRKVEIFIKRAPKAKNRSSKSRGKNRKENLIIRNSCEHDPLRPTAPFTGLTSIQCFLIQTKQNFSNCSVKEVDSGRAEIVLTRPLKSDQVLGISMSGPKQNFFDENYTPKPFGVLEWILFAVSLVLGVGGFVLARKHHSSNR